MTENTSATSARPDRDLIEGIAADLGVDPSFVEKDWHAMGVVSTIAAVQVDGIQPVFAGGTSLSKAYSLIERFSEDVDFRALIADECTRRHRRHLRERIVSAVDAASQGWRVCPETLTARDNSRFFQFYIDYQAEWTASAGLRPQIKVEMTIRSPVIEIEHRSVPSFVALATKEFSRSDDRIPCLSPVETAADKVCALSWRILTRDRKREDDDPTVIRHLHDLVQLRQLALGSSEFPSLVRDQIQVDAHNRRQARSLEGLSARQRLEQTLERLCSDSDYRTEYEQFVLALCYGAEGAIPTYDDGLCVLREIIEVVFG